MKSASSVYEIPGGPTRRIQLALKLQGIFDTSYIRRHAARGVRSESHREHLWFSFLGTFDLFYHHVSYLFALQLHLKRKESLVYEHLRFHGKLRSRSHRRKFRAVIRNGLTRCCLLILEGTRPFWTMPFDRNQ